MNHFCERYRNADDGEKGLNLTVLRQVYPAHREQLRAQIELWCVACAPALLALGRFTLMRLQALQLLLYLLVALTELRAHEVESAQRLLGMRSGNPSCAVNDGALKGVLRNAGGERRRWRGGVVGGAPVMRQQLREVTVLERGQTLKYILEIGA